MERLASASYPLLVGSILEILQIPGGQVLIGIGLSLLFFYSFCKNCPGRRK